MCILSHRDAESLVQHHGAHPLKRLGFATRSRMRLFESDGETAPGLGGRAFHKHECGDPDETSKSQS